MIVIFETQRYENYGYPHTTYWKAKGGRTIKVLDVPNDLTDESIADLYSALEFYNGAINDTILYHHKYDENAPTYEWEEVMDYADLINMKIEEIA
jgi:hypothetical protein